MTKIIPLEIKTGIKSLKTRKNHLTAKSIIKTPRTGNRNGRQRGRW
jgi:hypothetical protein